jgi:adenosylhomocysteine nucleosidase
MTEFPAMIAALPREVKGLVRGWDAREPAKNVFVWTNGRAVVACAGMGAGRVALAVEAARKAGPVSTLISVGLAGACDPSLKVAEIVRAGVVVDSRTGERFSSGDVGPVLVTASVVASVGEKARLFASYGAAAVDMEAATVARLARAHGLGFRAVKVISDEAGFELEELGRFATADGQFREGAFALHAAVRPWMWGTLIELGRNSSRAVAALMSELQRQIE